VEFAFRPAPEHEIWVADVAVTTLARWNDAPEQGWFPGAPELVIEVLSPSNTASEMYDRQRICFEGGCLEFWVVDPATRQIHVSLLNGPARTYRPGESVPVNLLGAASISVDQVLND
jgi:Uma2 family endonuclease